MKITIEQTEEVFEARKKMTFEYDSDDQDLGTMFDIFESILLAWGYHPDNIEKFINNE